MMFRRMIGLDHGIGHPEAACHRPSNMWFRSHMAAHKHREARTFVTVRHPMRTVYLTKEIGR
jgi:hypothetical protein